MVELYGSVITGFEDVAVEEVSMKLFSNARRGRGFVRFEVDLAKIPEVLI